MLPPHSPPHHPLAHGEGGVPSAALFALLSAACGFLGRHILGVIYIAISAVSLLTFLLSLTHQIPRISLDKPAKY